MLQKKFDLSRAISDRISSLVNGFENKEEEVVSRSEELETFHMKDFELETGNGYEIEEEEEEFESKVASRLIAFKEISKLDCCSEVDSVYEKRSELEFLLSREVINIEQLQSVASLGLPNEGGLRSMVWKLLLGYLPASQDLQEGELAERRLKYAKLKNELLINPTELTRTRDKPLVIIEQATECSADGPLRRQRVSYGDHPLSDGNTSIWHLYFQDAEIAEQIDRDLLRTHPEMKLFSGDSSFSCRTRQAMRNILLIFAKLNPEIHYVQGMNEVLAPLYYVSITDPLEKDASNAEADSFFCFVRLLSDSVDHFCEQLDNSSVGILSTLSRFTVLLKANDEELWRHLDIKNKVDPQYYAFRWITLLLTQEFSFSSILRIWDSLLSNPLGVQEMLLRICCAMLLCLRSRLLSGDFTANLHLLQHYPQINIEYLLQVAQELSTTASP
ncbi:hypothetical protein AQUCO_02000121v1 [Aquilegia coerulea]|uniref:Rab-GAP TBC domain-containing protein n=1 Tax=Aquilegia coerulea TaxID=218851 RepID=A0A2G5DGU5_AQUCA|nr:hypothetical protein AQUCO_02000121v1 [Aquilegia coerulea]